MNDARNVRENGDESKGKSASQIGKFYSGKNILLTGSTGFLGTSILEKILRSCKDIGKIYLTVKPKYGVAPEERIKKHFQGKVFDKLRETNPNFLTKVVLVESDLQKENLGISPEDRRRLTETLNVIVHNASLVYFEAKPSVLLRTNVLGTQQMLELASECVHLDAFVYVSTAYSHLEDTTIEEKFYYPPADIKRIKDIIRADEESATGLSQKAKENILGSYSNLYTYSKSVTEGLVESFGKTAKFPCIVYKPAIVIPSYVEPYPAWFGNNNGPIGLTTMVYFGFCHVLQVRGSTNMDAVPVDMSTNYLLALIRDHVVNRKTNDSAVYNFGSSDWNTFTYKHIQDHVQVARDAPSFHAVWYPFLILTPNPVLFTFLHTIFHIIPAIAIDIVRILTLKKPKYVNVMQRMMKMRNVLQPFLSTNWLIKVDKAKEIMRRMNEADLREFSFDLSTIDWYKSSAQIMGMIRRNRDKASETPEMAKRRLKTLMILHYSVCAFVAILFLLFLHHVFLLLRF